MRTQASSAALMANGGKRRRDRLLATRYDGRCTAARGLVLASSDFDVYLALRQGERPNASALAARFFARSKAHGAYPTADGRLFPDEAEAHQALTLDFAKKIERLAPLWRKAGLIETPR